MGDPTQKGKSPTPLTSPAITAETQSLRPKKPGENWVPDDSPETQKHDLPATTDPLLDASAHRKEGQQALREKDYGRATTEFMLAVNATATPRGAAELVRAATLSGQQTGAAATLEEALQDGGLAVEEALGVRRSLSRLYRQQGKYAKARAHLTAVSEAAPGGRRAGRMLAHLAMLEGNFERAAELLAEEAVAASAKGHHRSALGASLSRARLLESRVQDTTRAAASFREAARHARAAKDPQAALSASILAAQVLVGGHAPKEQVDAAFEDLTAAGQEAGRAAEVAKLIAELGQQHAGGGAQMLAMLGEAALARGAQQEASALLRAASESSPDNAALSTRLESHYVARAAWADLAVHYRERAGRERQRGNAASAAELLSRLAELLEDELSDRSGAAQAYAEILELTGDPAALASQLRLLSDSTDAAASVERALDAAVKGAKDPRARVEALVMRGEQQLARKQLSEAGTDFELALGIDANSIRALAGLAECKAEPALIRRLHAAVEKLSRGTPGKVAQARRVARLLEWPLGDNAKARQLWTEVLTEIPSDPEAEGRLIELCRADEDFPALIALLRRRLQREPRGPAAREARHELAHRLEALNREDEALEEWRTATRMEPGDDVALLALADRCERRNRYPEAAFCLEGAAAATEVGPPRAAIWSRLARLCRERLEDDARAAVCEERARAILAAPARPASGRASAVPAKDPSAVAVPRPEEKTDRGREATVMVSEQELPDELTGSAFEEILPPPSTIFVDEPLSDSRQDRTPVAHLSVEERSASFALPEPMRDHQAPSASALVTQLRELEEDPLTAHRYRSLARSFHDARDDDRAVLFAEIAAALEGRDAAESLPPKGVLTPAEWNVIRHPDLKGSIVELFTLAGAAMCGASSLTLKAVGAREPFAVDAGRGAEATASALLVAVRVLGVRSPDVTIADSDSPPVLAVNTDPPRLLIGKGAVRQALSSSELRFFAGRAMFTFRPEVMPLRFLGTDEITSAIAALDALLREEKPLPKEAKVLAKRIAPKALGRIGQLLTNIEKRPPDLDRLAEAARRTANRVGLVIAGGVTPAVVALRAKRGASEELVDLLRFVASDDYAALRRR